MLDRLLAWSAVLATALLVWPGLDRPFWYPKAIALGSLSAVGCAVTFFRPSSKSSLNRSVAIAGAWVASAAVSTWLGGPTAAPALFLEGSFGLWLIALAHRPLAFEAIQPPIALAGTAIAFVCLLQLTGMDPFGWLGWGPDHTGDRMKVYGTLGNPDFVCAYLGATVWATAAWAHSTRRRLLWVGVALQLAAIAATRSFGGAVALAGAAIFVWLVGGRRRWSIGGAILAVGLLAILLTLDRSLSIAAKGRIYLWRVAAPAFVQAPLFGQGPGSVEALWPKWEAAHWLDSTLPESDRAFRAPQDHLHCDYLEWLIEFGLVGLGVRLIAVWIGAFRIGQASPGSAWGAAGALGSLLTRACFDFPFARPAELCLLGVLLSATHSPEGEDGSKQLEEDQLGPAGPTAGGRGG